MSDSGTERSHPWNRSDDMLYIFAVLVRDKVTLVADENASPFELGKLRRRSIRPREDSKE